jgi:hypothetical protein
MSLSTIRTLDMKLSLTYIENSLRNTAFLLPFLDTEPEIKGRQYWPVNFKDDYTYYLKHFSNRSVLTSL